ncbi:nucleoside 2-deoxyribosyltransferase [Listeria monocytogenes]
MLVGADKVFLHINENNVSLYSLKNKKLKLLDRMSIIFEESCISDLLLRKIDTLFEKLEEKCGELNNKNCRVYATGMFQHLTEKEKTRLIIHIFVNFGLYFNIVTPELEQFYLENSNSLYGTNNMMDSILHQEFRKVVVCGSFQQHLKQIEEVMTILHKHEITVLSPWTTKIVPETIGTDFILLEGQEELKNERDTWKHKYEHMDKFRQSDAIIICNPDGVIGQGTMFEFGFMVANSKRVIFTDEPKDLSILFPYEIGLNF